MRLEAERRGIRIADDAVAQGVGKVEETAGGAQALDAALKEASVTRGQVGEAVRYSLLARAVADDMNADLEARPAQVRAFYDRHRDDLYTTDASYRLGKITVPGEKLAEKLVRRLRRGASFPAVARRYSMDQQTRYQGGEIGWVSAFTVPQEVLAVVEHVAPGGVADPVWSSGKWQVFKVLDRRPARVVPFAEAREPIAARIDAPSSREGPGPLARCGGQARRRGDDALSWPAGSPDRHRQPAVESFRATSRSVRRGRLLYSAATETYRRSSVRNALILLAVVALLILAVGALNNGTAFDVDYVGRYRQRGVALLGVRRDRRRPVRGAVSRRLGSRSRP